ncbi:hypothetical protein PENTCL1PPCAC_476, partial [Pristionchus entomophagus]
TLYDRRRFANGRHGIRNSATLMERCIFCGWNRRTAFPSIRFFMIPREPGMKQLMWMHAIDKKSQSEGGRYEQCPRDRVCSVHFRQGRPSNDPSHEDFCPHLYLTSEPPEEVLSYLENLAESKASSSGGIEHHVTVKNEAVTSEYKAHVNPMNPSKIEVSKVSRPSILQRKRKIDPPRPAPAEPTEEVAEPQEEEGEYAASAIPDMFAASHPDHRMAQDMHQREYPEGQRKVRLQPVSSDFIGQLGIRAGQTIVIKRKILKNSRVNSAERQ